ncbi:MAG: hypothetical protein CMM01_02280 [Rhodopirellula sp.]|nr:hypothetical protein [Rhodopirellula sp.]
MKEDNMNTRICSVIAVMTLVTFSSGCSGVKNFLFGRGARCGLCSGGSAAPLFGNTMQAPNPGTYQQPAAGCNGQVYSAQPGGGCGTTVPDNCGCGPYGNVDPYQSGQVLPQNGQIMGGTGGPMQTDSFNARKFDTDGSRILWEESAGGNSL